MFTEPAEVYDAIYFSFKDYAAEAAAIAQQIRAVHATAHTVLDVACGTGEHARLLATQHGLAVDGIDLNSDFLRPARARNPHGHFVVADMVDFTLPGRYDAVICMFSSIGYVRTLPRLESALRCFRRHLEPDGVILIEPWFPPEVMESGHQSSRSVELGGVRIERVGTTEITGRLCRLRFDYTMTEGGQRRHATELHELGLFTEEETLGAFAAAGLAAEHQAATSRNRGLYVARNAR